MKTAKEVQEVYQNYLIALEQMKRAEAKKEADAITEEIFARAVKGYTVARLETSNPYTVEILQAAGFVIDDEYIYIQ